MGEEREVLKGEGSLSPGRFKTEVEKPSFPGGNGRALPADHEEREAKDRRGSEAYT